MQRPVIHDFNKSLEKSQGYEDAPWWNEVYSEAFPNLAETISVRQDGWAQRGGIDRLVILEDGTVLKVDEKIRERVWGDFCLEYWSDRKRQIRGWVAKDLTCDYIAYAFVPNQTCYLLPFQMLRRAWRNNGQEWVRTYRKVEALNRGYTTVSVAVPIPVVLSAISDAMLVRWTAPTESIADEELEPDYWQARFTETDFE